MQSTSEISHPYRSWGNNLDGIPVQFLLYSARDGPFAQEKKTPWEVFLALLFVYPVLFAILHPQSVPFLFEMQFTIRLGINYVLPTRDNKLIYIY